MIQQFAYKGIKAWKRDLVDFESEDIRTNGVFVCGGAFGVGDEDLLFRSFGPENVMVEDYLDAVGYVNNQYTQFCLRWTEMYVLCLPGNNPQQSFEFAARSVTMELSAMELYQKRNQILR